VGKNYGSKRRDRELGIFSENSIFKNPDATEELEETQEEVFQSPPKIIALPLTKQKHNFQNGFITTENNIRTGICFLPNPKAVLVIPYLKEKNIQDLLFKEINREGIYRIKAFEKNEIGEDLFYSRNIFKFLYEAHWLTPQGKLELEAIQEVLRLREKDIEAYTGLGLILD